MADKIAIFALLCSAAAVIFGVVRYRQVRASTKIAAQDRLTLWMAEMAEMAEMADFTSALPVKGEGEAGVPDVPSQEPGEEPGEEPVQESVGRGVSEGVRPVDVRAEMDAFFGSGPPRREPSP